MTMKAINPLVSTGFQIFICMANSCLGNVGQCAQWDRCTCIFNFLSKSPQWSLSFPVVCTHYFGWLRVYLYIYLHIDHWGMLSSHLVTPGIRFQFANVYLSSFSDCLLPFPSHCLTGSQPSLATLPECVTSVYKLQTAYVFQTVFRALS